MYVKYFWCMFICIVYFIFSQFSYLVYAPVCILCIGTLAIPERQMIMLWYWLKMTQGSKDAIGKWHQWYVIWKSRAWEPRKEDYKKHYGPQRHDHSDPDGGGTPMCTVHGMHME